MTLSLTKPSAGQLQDATVETNNLTAIENAVNALTGGGSTTIAKKNSLTTITNTTTQTDIIGGGGFTLTANALTATGIAKVSLWGDFTQNTGISRNLTSEFFFGGSSLGSTVVSVASSATTRGWFAQVDISALNSTGSQYAMVNNGVGQTVIFSGTSTTTSVDTTSPVVITFKITMAVADVNFTVRCGGGWLEVVK